MSIKGLPNVECRGFDRKISFYTIINEYHFEEFLLISPQKADTPIFKIHSTECDVNQAKRSRKYAIFEPMMTFKEFIKHFLSKDFCNFSCISVNFIACECHPINYQLIRLAKLFNKQEDLRNATKIVSVTLKPMREFTCLEELEFMYNIEDGVNDIMKVNNLLFMFHSTAEESVPEWVDNEHFWWYEFRENLFGNILESILKGMTENSYYGHMIEWKTTSVDLYADAINPALVFIVNHLTFPDEKLYRKGSLEDAENLSKSFARKNIAQIIVRDGKIQHDDAVFNFLSHSNLSGLKDLYVFIMSHGHENDIIDASDRKYAIYERIKQVMKNQYLKHVNKWFFINACRGEIDPMWESAPVENTDCSMLDERTVVIHSAPKNYVSPRTDDGSVFLGHVRKIFDKPFQTLSVDEFCAKVDERLKQCDYYSNYENGRFDVVKHDQTAINMSNTLTNIKNFKFLKMIATKAAAARKKRRQKRIVKNNIRSFRCLKTIASAAAARRRRKARKLKKNKILINKNKNLPTTSQQQMMETDEFMRKLITAL